MGDHVADVVEEWRERRPDLDLTGMAVFARIARIDRMADLRRAEVLDRYELQQSEVSVLAALWRRPEGLRPLELRRRMLIGSGTLTPRLDRLEAAGLLERRPDPNDRRGRTLHLTQRGARLVPTVVTELLDIENEMLAELPPSVRARFCEDLGRLSLDLERDAE